MYSLYRAWFGEESYPRLESLSPPDTVVRVGNDGEHQFVAHRGVLAAHSGYLKALLATTGNGNSSRDGGVISVSVSSVGGEAFAPLLNYMYTGRLDVTLDNIYSVLLATHLLHMPGALEQCRAALLRLRGPPPPPPPLPASAHSSTGVLRPVPNRLIGPPICWPQPGLYSGAPVGLPHLPNLQLAPGLPLLQSPSVIHENPTTSTTRREHSPSPQPLSPVPQKPAKKSHQPRSKSPTSKKERKETIKSSEAREEHDKDLNQPTKPSPSETDGRTSVRSVESAPRISGRTSRLSVDQGSSGSGVILDIACCDGPVKFHRVLNENYTSPVDGCPTQPPPPQPPVIPEKAESIGENDENGRPDRNSDSQGESSGSGCYTCEYCQHTFKSHYCYKKHARRHLLPTDNETNARADGKRREVRLLDLNVQYYPCKICGSKFPSYYFVHKHKKMCHPNETERNNSEGENSQSLPSTSTKTLINSCDK